MILYNKFIKKNLIQNIIYLILFYDIDLFFVFKNKNKKTTNKKSI